MQSVLLLQVSLLPWSSYRPRIILISNILSQLLGVAALPLIIAAHMDTAFRLGMPAVRTDLGHLGKPAAAITIAAP